MIKIFVLLSLLSSPILAEDISNKIFPGGSVPSTGQTIRYSTTTGDDSYYNPMRPQPKLLILSVGISSVTYDGSTGLYWITNTVTDANIGGTYTWENAIAACEGLTYQGYSDWRLPNIIELLSSFTKYAVSATGPTDTAYFNYPPGNLWSSTTYTPITTNAYVAVRATGGNVVSQKTSTLRIRCVRGGI